MSSSCSSVVVPAVPTRQMVLGALCALLTVLIWSGWNIVSRLGTTQALSPADITFLRFTLAGIVALPILWCYRRVVFSAPKQLLALMVAGAGAPYVLSASVGFDSAPAAHGVLIPGTMVLWVALFSWLWLKESLRPARIIGYGIIAVTIAYRLLTHGSTDLVLLSADGWFLLASILWAIYTLCNKQAALPPLAAVATVAVGSLLCFSAPYAALQYEQIAGLPLLPSITQLIYQGIIVSFVALMAYNQAIAYIGPSRASAFAALIPATTTLLAMPILGEVPTDHDVVFVAALSLGVLFATGLLAPRRRAA